MAAVKNTNWIVMGYFLFCNWIIAYHCKGCECGLNENAYQMLWKESEC